jgi:ribosomal protein L35AE/L33A
MLPAIRIIEGNVVDYSAGKNASHFRQEIAIKMEGVTSQKLHCYFINIVIIKYNIGSITLLQLSG